MNRYTFSSIVIMITIAMSSCNKTEYKLQEQFSCEVNSTDHEYDTKYQGIIDPFTTNGITGLTVVIDKHNEDPWIGSSGYASIEESIKMNNCHYYQTASLAKSYVGILTLQLVESGKLDYHSNMADFLSEDILSLIPNSENISIKHLLQHTSGLPDIFDLDFIADFMNNPEKTYTTKELLEYLKAKEPLSSPGTEFHYSDANYMLLALIVDHLEGSHIELMQTNIFEALNLEESNYHTGDYPNLNELPQSYWDQYNTGNIENISELQKRTTNYIIGSDGVIASPMDVVSFYKNVFEGNLISEENKQLIINDHVEETNENTTYTGYSHGFMFIEKDGQTWIGHIGNHLGTSCYVFYNVETKDCLAAFTNTGTFFFIEKQALIFHELWEALKVAIQ